ncbi:MAG TPA: cytidine deaminase [Candidatus Onthovivens sp.]|nr:cytidine deaminase [Candidatus Onthovivens sp.]
MEWNDLYKKAYELTSIDKKLTRYMEVASVGCALETTNNNIYLGVNIDTACSLGMCAERNALANMLTHNESEIKRIVCVHNDGEVWVPCGACREFMMLLGSKNEEIEVLISLNPVVTKKLKELLPNWWGKKKVNIID